MHLRTKFALVLLVLTIVLSGATYGGLEFYKNQAVERANADVDATASLAARQIDTRIEDKQDTVAYIAQQVSADRVDESKSVMEAALSQSRFRAMWLVDGNGTVVYAQGPYTPAQRKQLVGSNVSDQHCVARTLATGDTCISEPQRVAESDLEVVAITAPLFDANATVTGTLFTVIPITEQTLFPVADPLQTDRQTITITANGTVLHERHRTFPQEVTSSAIVEETGWRVTVSRDRSQLNARLRRLAVAQGIGLFLVFSTIVGLGVWEYRSNLSQTERLLDGFERLAQGEYDQSPNLNAGEEWIQIQSAFEDLADGLARRESELRQREERLQVLNRVVRHNLRNEMNVVLGYADHIRSEADDEHLEGAADTIHETAERLAAISDKAREIETTLQGEIDPHPVDLTEIVEDVVSRQQAAYSEVEIRTKLPDTCWIHGHSSLADAVENVVENACEYNRGENQWVVVNLDSIDGQARLTVEDNGPGIPENERIAINRGRETALEHGSGLGLWLSKWFVQQVDGTFDLAETETGGTLVTMEFQPASENAESESTERDAT